jgi:thioredoxin 1
MKFNFPFWLINYSKSGFQKNPILFIILALVKVMVLAILLISCQNTTNKEKSSIKESDSLTIRVKLTDSLDHLYNYSKNKQSYELTFLEFGSVGCIECKKMEKVLEEVKNKYKGKINVVFYNARVKQNKKIFNYYGINLIPIQVLLDKRGKERFRHTGFYSLNELIVEFNKISNF